MLPVLVHKATCGGSCLRGGFDDDGILAHRAEAHHGGDDALRSSARAPLAGGVGLPRDDLARRKGLVVGDGRLLFHPARLLGRDDVLVGRPMREGFKRGLDRFVVLRQALLHFGGGAALLVKAVATAIRKVLEGKGIRCVPLPRVLLQVRARERADDELVVQVVLGDGAIGQVAVQYRPLLLLCLARDGLLGGNRALRLALSHHQRAVERHVHVEAPGIGAGRGLGRQPVGQSALERLGRLGGSWVGMGGHYLGKRERGHEQRPCEQHGNSEAPGAVRCGLRFFEHPGYPSRIAEEVGSNRFIIPGTAMVRQR